MKEQMLIKKKEFEKLYIVEEKKCVFVCKQPLLWYPRLPTHTSEENLPSKNNILERFCR